jgi:hypothetical protein
MESVQECVARGIALLDEKRPNWRRRLDADLLDLSDQYLCVGGQLDGSYAAAMIALGVTADAESYGFTASCDLTVDHENDMRRWLEDCNSLRDEWIRQLSTDR